ncbi:archease [Candidatus Pacearchaeota archaeon]|nr:archease [Candidatus Pacearchaeota archaeon]
MAEKNTKKSWIFGGQKIKIFQAFRFLEHTSEIKFRAYGKTLKEVFENSAGAFSHFVGNGQKISSEKKRKIEVEGKDYESLLYNFLDELIYLFDSEHFIVKKAEVKIEGKKLKAELFGDDSSKYSGLDHVKAATYAEMYVKKKRKGWEIQAVVDV